MPLKFILVIFVVCLIYLIGSQIAPSGFFNWFDIGWRLVIIGGCWYFGQVRLAFSSKQWSVLALVFSCGLWLGTIHATHTTFTNLLIKVAFGPIAEEILFRGWLINQLNGFIPRKTILSSLLFGLYHIKNFFVLTPLALLFQIFYATIVVGPVFAWLRLRYNSLFPSLALHSINNFIAITITSRLLPLS